VPLILLHLFAASLYAALGFVLLRAVASPSTVGSAPGWVRWAVLIPFAAHTWLLRELVFGAGGMALGMGVVVSIIAWLSVLIYWSGSFFHRLDGLQTLVIPVASFAALVPVMVPPPRLVENAAMPGFRFHLAASMLAYSLFTIASLHAMLMAVQERRLREGNPSPLLRSLPPLLTMEKLLFRIISAGFALLTLSLASGMLFSEQVFGKPLQFNHKTVFGILSWLIFGGLLLGRALRGWRGRMALRWTLAGFFALVLAYIGSRFVLEVILRR
jgi:ABC-type uncharacterized transport system permease subunit